MKQKVCEKNWPKYLASTHPFFTAFGLLFGPNIVLLCSEKFGTIFETNNFASKKDNI